MILHWVRARRTARERRVLAVLLAADRPMGAYEICRRAKAETAPLRMYVQLLRLEQQGLLDAHWGPGPEPIMLRELTPAGRAYAAAMVEESTDG